MEKREQLYEGKAKKVFATDDADLVIVDYKDDATAFNGEKRGTIAGKGVINNRVTNHLMTLLEEQGVPTHFVRELSDRETLVKKVAIVPLEVIVRNISAGSFAKRYGVEEGIVFDAPTIEFSYKNDSLGDPLINSYHALALKLADREIHKNTMGEYPIMLLDDVLSELDPRRQEYVLNRIAGGQVFITCCENDRLDTLLSGKVFHIRGGEVLT